MPLLAVSLIVLPMIDLWYCCSVSRPKSAKKDIYTNSHFLVYNGVEWIRFTQCLKGMISTQSIKAIPRQDAEHVAISDFAILKTQDQ